MANFFTSPKTYHNVATIQKKSNEILLQYANFNAKNSKVLDIGCGSGYLCELFTHLNLLGIDVSKEMIDHCKQEYPFGDFVNIDLRDFRSKEKFDYIFSNFVWQWISFNDKISEINRYRKMLSANGCLCIAFPVKGTLIEVEDCIRNCIQRDFALMEFNEAEEVISGLRVSNDYDIEYKIIQMPLFFNDIGSFFHYIKKMKAYNVNSFLTRQELKKLLHQKNKIVTNYNVMFLRISCNQ